MAGYRERQKSGVWWWLGGDNQAVGLSGLKQLKRWRAGCDAEGSFLSHGSFTGERSPEGATHDAAKRDHE